MCESIKDVKMESALKEQREGESVVDMATPAGGVEDVYGEDCATEDQCITPWTIAVSRYLLYFPTDSEFEIYEFLPSQ